MFEQEPPKSSLLGVFLALRISTVSTVSTLTIELEISSVMSALSLYFYAICQSMSAWSEVNRISAS